MQSNRRPFTIESKGRRPFKAPKWSHQQELDALKGKKIAIRITGEAGVIEGTLLEADQFAIKLQCFGVSQVFFKHDIARFWEEK